MDRARARVHRVHPALFVLALLIAIVVTLQAAAWQRRVSALARGLGLWGPRGSRRPQLAVRGLAPTGVSAAAAGRAAAEQPAVMARAPPAFLVDALPGGAPPRAWATQQVCSAAADESEVCTYAGPLCTDGSVLYVSAADGQRAWPEGAGDTQWPPWSDVHRSTGCWDTRTMDATRGCGGSHSMDRSVPTDGGGAADGGAGLFWGTPIDSGARWGPAGALVPVVPLHWSVFADAVHAGPHALKDPTRDAQREGEEWWKSPALRGGGGGGGEGSEKGAPDPAMAAAAACAAAQAPGAGGPPSLLLQWLDGPLWATHMSVGWLGHPWHWATAAFPLWTAKRRNATLLHVPREVGGSDGGGGGRHIAPAARVVGVAPARAGDDDSSATRELLLASGGSVLLPRMAYVAMLQGPAWEGLDDEGRLQGNLGWETPSRLGRGVGDLGAWQKGVWPLLVQPDTVLLTPRTMAVSLGVSPATRGSEVPPHARFTPTSNFDAARDATCPTRGNATAQLVKRLPRLLCSAHGGAVVGMQPRIFAGVADAHAFRVAAWARAGVLRARADAERMGALLSKGGAAGALHAADTSAPAYLRGAMRRAERARAAHVAGAAAPPTANTGADGSVRWWDTFPPRQITVVTRQGTRQLTPQLPLRALLRHVGLPVRWLTGLGSRSWEEQVSVLSATGIFLAAHGGDMVGIPFLPPSAAVIEAFPYTMDHEGYRHLAESSGARYTRLAAPPPTHPSELAPTHAGLRETHGAPPLPLPAHDEDRADTWDHNGFEALMSKPDFEAYCEDPQRVSSLDSLMLIACNGRSKNVGVELHWPALVTALVNALDDIGCRPRQFSAAHARAIRAAQRAAGLNYTLWEGWRELARSPPPPANNPLALRSGSSDGGSLISDALRALGFDVGDVSEAGDSGELWGGDASVHGTPPTPGTNASSLAELPGVPMRNLRLEDVHLVPVTGGDGREGAQMPYINVRAKCMDRAKVGVRDKSPWA